MSRTRITKAVSDEVLKEYDHLCAVCGKIKPQLHHIDEDHSNSVAENLIPLCPNCHLTDQHNPTKKIPIPVLKLFRQYKDPAILKPQFRPIYNRIRFILEHESSETHFYDKEIKELTSFLKEHKMGEYYSASIKKILPKTPIRASVDYGNNSTGRKISEDIETNYSSEMLNCRCEVINLIIEMLCYQDWANS